MKNSTLKVSGPGFENCSFNVQKIKMPIKFFWPIFWHETISNESTGSPDSKDTKLMCGSRNKVVKVRRQSERVARIRENRHEIHI